MNKEQIENILEQAKNCFLEKDQHLLSVEANERSLTHKFAEHLQNILGCKWDVDCEYNRDGTDPKKISEIIKIVGENTTTDKTNAKTVYPDIIVHKRGKDGPNLLVIEAKKDATPKKRAEDIDKLKKIQEQYGYTFMVFMDFKIKKEKEIKWKIL